MSPKSPRIDNNVGMGENVLPPKKELLYEGIFYDVSEWVKRHPGGKIIEFYTRSGEDSTLAVQQFHQRSTKKIMAIMSTLKQRPASTEELNMDTETMKRHQALTKDFLKLHNELVTEGYFKPSILHILYRLIELLILWALGFYILTNDFNRVWKFFGCLAYALFAGRCGFLMHEVGHYALTGNPKVDRFIQAFLSGIGVGLSSSWWRAQHNRHHAMTQRLNHDVDLQTLPLIAFNSKIVRNPKHGQTFLIQNQALLFVPIYTYLVVMFWKFYLHPMYIMKKGNYHELIFFGIHYYMGFHIGLFNYLFVLWLVSICVFGTFALSHTHMPVTSNSLHWVGYSLLHTMNIQPSWWMDWWMGYLDCQIEHHLFPTMPGFRNPLIVDKVKALAAKHNIPYQCTGYGDAVVKTLRNLSEVSIELKRNRKMT